LKKLILKENSLINIKEEINIINDIDVIDIRDNNEIVMKKKKKEVKRG
jgi:hypothetical protein